MFIGEYVHAVDPKGRVSMPSKFREELSERFFVTKGLDQCLFVFPETEWARIEEKLKALPLANNSARGFVRMFYSGACECTFDKQGRILLPQPLREHAGITANAVVIGVGERIEIWSEAQWQAYTSPEQLSYDALAEQMADLGI